MSPRRTIALAGTVAATLLLAACGFTPLYGAPGVAPALAGIHVVAPEGRAGELIRESLDDSLASGRGAPALYRLNMTLNEVRYPRGLRVDNVATRYELVLTANYALTELASNTVIKSGVARASVTYDSSDQPYASIAAQQDGEERAAAEAAERIQLDLASWFAQRQ